LSELFKFCFGNSEVDWFYTGKKPPVFVLGTFEFVGNIVLGVFELGKILVVYGPNPGFYENKEDCLLTPNILFCVPIVEAYVWFKEAIDLVEAITFPEEGPNIDVFWGVDGF